MMRIYIASSSRNKITVRHMNSPITQTKRAGYSLCCVKSRLKRRFSVTRWRDHLSSGEKRAGCADLVTWPWATFLRVYRRLPLASRVYMRCMMGDLVSGGELKKAGESRIWIWPLVCVPIGFRFDLWDLNWMKFLVMRFGSFGKKLVKWRLGKNWPWRFSTIDKARTDNVLG